MTPRLSSPVLERFLRYVTYDTQSREDATTYPSTPGQLVLLRDLVAELQGHGHRRRGDGRARLRDGDHPGHDRQAGRAGDRLHRARRHVARDERRQRHAARAPRLRRPRSRAARRPRGGPARRRLALPWGVPRPRHRHGIGHDAARRRQQERRGGDHDRGGIPDGASGDPARGHPHRVHAGRGGRPRHRALRRGPLRRPLRLHDGRRAARRARVRELLGRRDHADLSRLQHAPGLRQGPDGERDQAGGALHRPAAGRSPVAGDDRRPRGLRPPLRGAGGRGPHVGEVHRARLRHRRAAGEGVVAARTRRGSGGGRARRRRWRSRSRSSIATCAR